jgi:hypothetical protein
LHTEADTEEGAIGLDVIFKNVYEVMLAEGSDGIAEGTDAGEYDTCGVSKLCWGGRDFGGFTDEFEGFLDAAEVAHAVVDDCGSHGGSFRS